MPNLYKRFQALIPSDPLQIAEVRQHHADGTSTVESPGGALYRIKGTSVDPGSNAYIQGGRIIDDAPDLPLYDETI